MADRIVPIEPTVITETKNVAKVEMRIMNLDLFKSVDIICTLLDADNAYCGSRSVHIEQPEYSNWTADDSTLVAMVLAKLGFTPAPAS